MDRLKITLKAARINAGLSQTDAAITIGVSRDTISNWERGKSYPNADHILRIENAYGVEYDNLIFLPRDYA